MENKKFIITDGVVYATSHFSFTDQKDLAMEFESEEADNIISEIHTMNLKKICV